MIIEGLILAIVGDRNFVNYEWLKAVIDKVNSPIYCIVSGGARGADTLAERYAREHEIDMLVHPAHWDKYGKSAGYRRNKKIVKDADAMVAFLAKGSRGTKSSIDLANEKGIPVHIVHV
jgi:hypothetical protein